MSRTKTRASGPEIEQLRRRVWVMRSRGMTFKQIADAVQRDPSTVHYHWKKACEEATTKLEGAGQPEVIGNMMLTFRELRPEALRNLSQVEQGSPMRANWLALAGKRLDAEKQFMLEVGLLDRASDKVELTVKDVRKMSDEEIQREVENLRRELAFSPPPPGEESQN